MFVGTLCLCVCSLLYITSLGYRWLKSDDLSEEFLKTGEVVLLRVLFLASLRLYCHILTGDMKVCVKRDSDADMCTAECCSYAHMYAVKCVHVLLPLVVV